MSAIWGDGRISASHDSNAAGRDVNILQIIQLAPEEAMRARREELEARLQWHRTQCAFARRRRIRNVWVVMAAFMTLLTLGLLVAPAVLQPPIAALFAFRTIWPAIAATAGVALISLLGQGPAWRLYTGDYAAHAAEAAEIERMLARL